MQPTILDKMVSNGNIDFNPFFLFFSMISKSLSPYQWNPLMKNTLKDLLLDVIDFDAIQKERKHKLFLTATNIRTSKVKIFHNPEITVDAVCASACLPHVFQAVEIEGEFYWDGGYIGNPAMFPLFEQTQCTDLMLIQIDNIDYNKVPTKMSEIIDRATDISFNSSLMREMRAISFVTKIIEKGFDDDGRLIKTNIHYISTGDLMNHYSGSSKLNVDWDWLCYLRENGRTKAETWIREHYEKIGRESSCDVNCIFL
jgi:NTE family protein